MWWSVALASPAVPHPAPLANARVVRIAVGADPACPPASADLRWTVWLEATGPGAPAPAGEPWCWAVHSPAMSLAGAAVGDEVACGPSACAPLPRPRACPVPFVEVFLGFCPFRRR